MLTQCGIAQVILCQSLIGIMAVAIDLDDKPRFVTRKIDHEWPKRNLLSEVVPLSAQWFDELPEFDLGDSRVLA